MINLEHLIFVKFYTFVVNATIANIQQAFLQEILCGVLLFISLNSGY